VFSENAYIRLQSTIFGKIYSNKFFIQSLSVKFFLFSGPQICPSQRGSELREDIISLVRFWQSLHSDKKYLKSSYFNDVWNEGSTPTLGLTAISADLRGSPEFTHSRATPTGWINTVPLSSNMSSASKRSPSFKGSQSNKNFVENSTFVDYFVKDYVRKRNLILSLLAIEIELLITWHNPTASPEASNYGEETISKWRNQPMTVRLWKETARLAWDISPTLAVYLPCRSLSLLLLKFNHNCYSI
jgi:phosphatidylinositol 4-kinase